MSGPSPFGGFGGNNPLEYLLGDLLKLMSTNAPVQWDLARQLAHTVASDGQPEPNVDPIERIRLEELARVAELHVSDATGLNTSTTGGLVSISALSRSEWAWHTLDAWRPLFETLAKAIHPASPDAPPPTVEDHPGFAQLMGSLGQVMGPTLLGLQVGSALGHLARRAMGPYVLPIPRPRSDELGLVASNISSFANDWSLPVDDVRLWVCLSELTHHSVLGRPHVRRRLEELLSAYVGGFRPDTAALEELLRGLDPTDPAAIQAAMGDPAALLGERATPEQTLVAGQIEALVVVLEGYADHVTDLVGSRLIASYGSLAEAMRRQRVDRDPGEAMIEQLVGMDMGQDRFDQGTVFVRGVIDRAGPDALARLWESSTTLPTPAEVGAPGLWLARIDLPTRPGPEDQSAS